MDEMYKEDTIHGAEAMDDEAEIWGVQSSPLAIAYENVMYDVVAHVCSRKNMNKQWYNNLAPDLKPFCKVNLIKFLSFYVSKMYFITETYLGIGKVHTYKIRKRLPKDDVCMSLIFLF